MKNVWLYLFFILCFYKGFCQTNLVPNPSFEQFSSCPNNVGEEYLTGNWISFGGTPELFSQCSNIVGVPDNGLGFQYAASGVSYTGVGTYDNTCGSGLSCREYIGTLLNSPLVKNTKYFTSMRVSPGFQGQTGGADNVFTSNFGFLFTRYRYLDTLNSNNALTKNFAHVFCPTIISDTTNWTMIKGSFVADSNYTYVVLGNFFKDANTLVDSTIAHQNSLNPTSAFYYIDNVCVSTDSLFTYNYQYTAITENKINELFRVYPNPCNDYLVIDIINNEKTELSLLNILGEEVLNTVNYSDKMHITTASFPNGIYFLTIKNKETTDIKKITINH